jgi:hypothetical protein
MIIMEGEMISEMARYDAGDLDWSATLLRDSEEESQVRIVRDSIIYLGHQVVTGDPRMSGHYAQVRLFGAARPGSCGIPSRVLPGQLQDQIADLL